MGMDMNEYQSLAQRTASTNNITGKIMNGCMGLNGEAGECIDIVKKYMYQGHELDRNALIEECGDVLWYLAEVAAGLGMSLSDIAEQNINKLKKRYPEGFDAERSVNRAE